MAARCSACGGSGFLLGRWCCPLCEGDVHWLDEPDDLHQEFPAKDFPAKAWQDLEDADEGEVMCFIARKRHQQDRYVVVVMRKENEEFQLKHLENALSITKKKITPATEEECLRLFGFSSECMPPIGFDSRVEVFLYASLRNCLMLKFPSSVKGMGHRCTWQALENYHGSDRWIGAFNKGNKGGVALPCRFWESMDSDNISNESAEKWKTIPSSQVKEWLSQVIYKRTEIVLEEEPVVGEEIWSRYFTPVDPIPPSALGRYGGTTENLFNFLKWNVEWTTSRPNFAVAWYTAKGFEIPYEYGLGPRPPVVFPPWLEVLKEHMMMTVGLDATDPPTGCNFNFYKDGSGALNPHSDNEEIFDGLNQPITIVSFSIGQERTFQIDKNFRKKSKIKAEKKLASLSYFTMEGLFQKHLKHALPSEPDLSDPRINMTWRWIVLEDRRVG
mmetsp:Transcript_2829/g.3059  ORF Transcript_2829/g.3059 Transcript_2829/m.3059 type:complete len:443 (-) Transcript_2829:100-1428(-)